MKPIIIGSRGSRLALIQAESVKTALEAAHSGLQVTIKVIKTKGDLILDRTLDKIGGKGLFVKEIQQALLDKSIDLAVHSMKDVPGVAPEGLTMAAVTRREDPRDVLVTAEGFTPETLPEGAVIGTSSLRRQAQIRSLRPDCRVVPLRGNVQTRLQKMKEQQLTGILLAAAGLKRLQLLDELPHSLLDPQAFVPAVGQGALGCEIREADVTMKALLASLEDADTRVAILGERAFLNRLEGDCHVPVGAFGRLEQNQLMLTGLVAAADGSRRLQQTVTGDKNQAEALGRALAEDLIAQGAWELMKAGGSDE
ncbi:hydroxymethylbilane synthase [Anoxynatronum buryatiense]|uniref:Porphobilinogen deaminase n=1 Tax=Anoxynatronum buryatiense TaxID=489973 RepID=A0AA45WVQ1_9CLOT|nr:hydroxymethylbilane synthase [Anoxynatronum buryatiense]SMP54263.1 hydroxymethylbilane synthase [Anoxynatronum buryatiense]